MTRIFRPADPAGAPISPSWRQWRGLLYVVGARILLRSGRLLRSASLRWFLGLAGLVVQSVLLVLGWELVRIAVDVSELWLELARKHYELTL